MDEIKLQVQRHLQLRIEAQGKYLQSVLEKAQETLGRQNLGAVGLEAAKVQLSELVSKVSNQCLNSAFAEVKGIYPRQAQPTNQLADCSMDSCLTFEGSQKDVGQEIHNTIPAGTQQLIRPNNYNNTSTSALILEPNKDQNNINAEELMLQKSHEVLKWCELEPKETNMFRSSSSATKDITSINAADQRRRLFPGHVERSSSASTGLSMSIGGTTQGDQKADVGRMRGFRSDAAEDHFLERNTSNISSSVAHSYNFAAAAAAGGGKVLDLNAHHHDHENDSSSSCKQFDLNGFSWS